MSVTIFTRDDLDLIVAFAGCSLDERPGSNWVQDAGGLPEYICQVARAIKRSGHSTSRAISIAVSRIKKWATGVGVNTDTQAKAAKALAQWEALKVKAHAKKAAKKTVKTTATDADHEILCLTATMDFNVDNVRTAWDGRQRKIRKEWFAANPGSKYESAPGHLYIRELWTKYLIVASDYDGRGELYKVAYTVDGDGEVEFSDPVKVKTEYVTVEDEDSPGSMLTDAELLAMMEGKDAAEVTTAAEEVKTCALSRVLAAASGPSPLNQILALAEGQMPYGNVTYADPGYQSDKQKRYPVNTAARCRAAWSYINQADNAKLYTPAQLTRVKNRIKAAAQRLGVTISED